MNTGRQHAKGIATIMLQDVALTLYRTPHRGVNCVTSVADLDVPTVAHRERCASATGFTYPPRSTWTTRATISAGGNHAGTSCTTRTNRATCIINTDTSTSARTNDAATTTYTGTSGSAGPSRATRPPGSYAADGATHLASLYCARITCTALRT